MLSSTALTPLGLHPPGSSGARLGKDASRLDAHLTSCPRRQRKMSERPAKAVRRTSDAPLSGFRQKPLIHKAATHLRLLPVIGHTRQQNQGVHAMVIWQFRDSQYLSRSR